VLFAAFYFTLLLMVLGGYLSALFSPYALDPIDLNPAPAEVGSAG
jgi:hypothetical protein